MATVDRNPPAAAAPAGAPQAQPQPGSFHERKMQSLADEKGAAPELREQQPPQERDLQEQTPHPDDGSAEDVGQDTQEGLYAEDNDEEYEDDGSTDPDGTPGDSDPDAEIDDFTWEKRYKDLQSETQTIRENRGEMDQEHAESMAQHLRLRFDLEDRLNEAATRAEFLRNTMTGNAQKFQNINWSQVPPDQIQSVQAQAQQAFMMQQQADQAYDQIMGEVGQTKTQVKQREAAIAKTRLRRTIPNWGNETYGQLREFATSGGMPPEQFNEITDPQVIEWAYSAMQIKNAGSKGVQNVNRNRKAKVPRGRNPKRQARDERGKFAQAQLQPNQRGSFAEKHKHRLAMERHGR